jgi:hypothetical protein
MNLRTDATVSRAGAGARGGAMGLRWCAVARAGSEDDLLFAVCRVPALGGDRGQLSSGDARATVLD